MAHFEGISGSPLSIRRGPMGELILTIGQEYAALHSNQSNDLIEAIRRLGGENE